MYSYKRERAKRLYPEPAIFNNKVGGCKRLTVLATLQEVHCPPMARFGVIQ